MALGHARALLMSTCGPDDPAPCSLLVPARPQPLLTLDKDLAFMVSRDSPLQTQHFPSSDPILPRRSSSAVAPWSPLDNCLFPLTLHLSFLCHGGSASCSREAGAFWGWAFLIQKWGS